MKKLKREFYNRSPEIVSRQLLGKLLVRKVGTEFIIGKIVETEAYFSGDLASHALHGQTKRNAPMFGPPGKSYVYFTYGMHWLLNIVTEKQGIPSAVLIRAVEPIFGQDLKIDNCKLKIAELMKLGSGPARLTKWLRITGELNNIDVTNSTELFLADTFSARNIYIEGTSPKKSDIVATERVGINYAGEHKKLPLRFYLKGNPYISKK